MKKLGNALVKFLKSEDGPTAVEYAVMLALIIVVCIGSHHHALGLNANKHLQLRLRHAVVTDRQYDAAATPTERPPAPPEEGPAGVRFFGLARRGGFIG